MLELVIDARKRDLGGFEVGRVLPGHATAMVGPFIFFDHMGPVTLPADVPRRTDVRPHPHIGLATITYLFSGEIVHRDSAGFHKVDPPGRSELDDCRQRHQSFRALRHHARERRASCTASRPGWRCPRRTRKPIRTSCTSTRTSCRSCGSTASVRVDRRARVRRGEPGARPLAAVLCACGDAGRR